MRRVFRSNSTQADHRRRTARKPVKPAGILQSTADGILAVSKGNKVLFSNERFAQLWQIPKDIISAGDDTALLQHVLVQLDDPQIFLQKVQALYQSKEESFDTLNFKDGRTFERRSRPLMQDGKLRGRVWSFRDITKQKQAEQALAFSEERFRSIIELTSDAVSLLDKNFKIIYSSPVVERRLGYPSEERGGHSMFELVHPDHLPAILAAMQQVSERPFSSIAREVRLLHKDGSWLWFDATATNLLTVPAVQAIVTRSHEVTDRKKLEELLKQQATTDELTGCANRRHFLEMANSEITRSARLKRSLALAIFDMDHFKQINDTYGHAAGDQALVTFTKACKRNIREIDMLARIGGDEFALLLPEANSKQAFEIVERVRKALAAMPVEMDGKQVTVATSCGISDLTDEMKHLDILLGNADQALTGRKKWAATASLFGSRLGKACGATLQLH